MKKITTHTYAKIRGISLQAVTKMIRTKGTLPGVVKVERFSRIYILHVKKSFLNENSN